MSNAVSMTVAHGFKENLTSVTSLLFVVKGLLHDSVQQFTSDHFFRDHVIVVIFTVGFVEANNVRMVEVAHDIDFNLKGIKVGLVHALDFYNLDGIRFLGLAMGAIFDHGIGSGTELRFIETKRVRTTQ